LAHSRSFLANQKARNAIVGAENLLIHDSLEKRLATASLKSIKGRWSEFSFFFNLHSLPVGFGVGGGKTNQGSSKKGKKKVCLFP